MLHGNYQAHQANLSAMTSAFTRLPAIHVMNIITGGLCSLCCRVRDKAKASWLPSDSITHHDLQGACSSRPRQTPGIS